MNKNTLPLEELYTGHIFDMNDALTFDEIMEYEDNQRKRSEKLNEIKQFLKECTLEDFVYVIIRIFKDKTPVITVFNDVIFSEKYLNEVFSETRRQKDIKEALFNIHSSSEKWYYENLQFNYKSSQSMPLLLQSVTYCLNNKNISISGNEISIDDCPISKIKITSDNIQIIMNTNKATKYS